MGGRRWLKLCYLSFRPQGRIESLLSPINRMLTAAVEGLLDQAVAQVIAPVTGHQIQRIYVTNGKSGLDNRLRGFNNAARFAPWFVLRDFDADAPCPGELQRTLLSSPSRYMCFRL